MATVEVDEDGYDDFGRKKIKARADKKAKEVRGRQTGRQTYQTYMSYRSPSPCCTLRSLLPPR